MKQITRKGLLEGGNGEVHGEPQEGGEEDGTNRTDRSRREEESECG
ncbi:hypothetical protein GA8_14920 [Geobacillus sp. A8]|nr:hypothetical protein GA8_14920 [Geobacillus sp. A8]